jgi:hypothetical protein
MGEKMVMRRLGFRMAVTPEANAYVPKAATRS